MQAFTQQSNARVTENWTVIEDAMVTRQISADLGTKIDQHRKDTGDGC